MGPDAMIFIFWMLSSKPVFSLSSFTIINRLFSSSLLSSIRVVSSTYLILLIFLPAILIPTWTSSSQHFSWCTLHISRVTLYILDIFLSSFEPDHCSISNYCFLTHIQVSQEAGKVVWYSYLFQNFPQFVVIHTFKSFSLINEAEADVFMEFSCFYCDPTDVGNLISGSSNFSKSSLNIWKFLVQVLLKPSLDNFEHYFASMWNERNCAVFWIFFDIALRDWNENWSFPGFGQYEKAKKKCDTERWTSQVGWCPLDYWRITEK